MGRQSYIVTGVANGHAAVQKYSTDRSAIGGAESPPGEVVLDCRRLQDQLRDSTPALLKEFADDGYAPRNRMIGWSCAFLVVSGFLLISGGVMLALSLIVESESNSLAGYYDVPTTQLGAGLLGVAAVFFLLAIIKVFWHRHL